LATAKKVQKFFSNLILITKVMIQKTAFSIYDASAGSGKTYTLVKEYLKIILIANKNDAYRNILAITFTNKAVHEMKSRVVDSLSEFSKDTPSEKAQQLMQDISQDTGLNHFAIKEKAKSIIKNLIHNYAAFDISTIDKFTHKVIRAFAHDLGLPITFEVSTDTENLLTEAIDALISQAGEDEILTKLLVDFTMEKTDDDKSWDVSREIMDTGRLLLNENNREEVTHFHDKSIPEFTEIKTKLLGICDNLESETVAIAAQTLQLIDQKGIDIKSFSAGHFPNHLKSIVEKRFNAANKTYHEFDDIKINKTAKDRAIIEEIIPTLLDNLAQIYAHHQKIDFYLAFCKNITPLSLLNTVSNELAKIQKDQNVLSIAEFNKLIFEQIQNQPAPFIYERLGEKYRHFFIDEFQDTSEMQWLNLIPLIDNATSSEDLDGQKGSLLIVGDPKQSIYRWRGGKAEQFIALSKDKNPFNNPDKKAITLDTNYRSFSEVIDFNNNFFQMLSDEFSNEDYIDLYKNHSFQKSNSKQGGHVSISFISEDEELPTEDLFLLATYQKIEALKAEKFKNNDIVILTRKTSQGSLIANFLNEKGLPVLSSESLLLASSSEVKCIIFVLKYLNNNSDTDAKVNFLYYIAKFHQTQLPIHDFILLGKDWQTEVELENWLKDYGIDFSFKNVRKKSLYEATELIISKMILKDKRSAYTQFFLDVILEHDIKKQAGIADFLHYWNQSSHKLSIPSPEGIDAVRIMTIHKSKGLEFPVVIFPFAEEDYSKGPKEKIWLNADEETFGLPKALVDKSSKIEGYGEDAKLIYNQKKQEDLLDDVNVLYVALTRAEEQLHVISKMNLTKDDALPNNMSSFFIKYLENHGFDKSKKEYLFGDPKRISKIKDKIDNSHKIPVLESVLDFKNIKIAQRESVMWDTKQQVAIEYGNLVHEILSFVNTKNDVSTAITKAIENGLLIATQKEEMTNVIHQIINHQALTDYFNEEHLVINEQMIIQKNAGLMKPDRMVVTTLNEVYLLDYKTGAYHIKHQLQLENYQKAIEDMGYKVSKKALIYIGQTIEVVNL
jgi:ATP-dependent exoDNAse (exonuclease V) beta subunit